MKILLIGECYSRNIGDQLVTETSEYLLKALYPEATFEYLDLQGRTRVSKRSANIYQDIPRISLLQQIRLSLIKYSLIEDIVSRRSANRLKTYYESKISSDKFDFAVFTGGQLIYDTFVFKIKLVTDILSAKRIPVFFNAVGIGNLTHNHAKIYRKILEKDIVKGITCRCNSQRFYTEIDTVAQINETFDTAIMASDIYNNYHRSKSGVIGLGVMQSSRINDEKLISFWSSIIKKLEERSLNWKFLYTGSDNDIALITKIASSVGIDLNEKIRTDINTPEDFISELVQCNKILSFRLHSHILSYSFGIPSLGISWDNKIKDFFSKIGRPNMACDLNQNINVILDKLLSIEEYDTTAIKKTKSQCKEMIQELFEVR